MGLDSVWFIQAPSTAEALYADIRKYMDNADRHMVTTW